MANIVRICILNVPIWWFKYPFFNCAIECRKCPRFLINYDYLSQLLMVAVEFIKFKIYLCGII